MQPEIDDVITEAKDKANIPKFFAIGEDDVSVRLQFIFSFAAGKVE